MPRTLCMHENNTRGDGFFSFFLLRAAHFSPQQLSTSKSQLADNCNDYSIGYVTPSNSGNTGYTAINTRQYCEGYCRYSPALRARGVSLHMNACGEKSMLMNRQVLWGWFLYQSLTRVTKSYLSALGTTQISSCITKH